MPNHLISETSPYLRQHAHNPVNWYPWGEEALSKARAEDKPIFLSIGYAACHWCHVMERESFENQQTAEILNRSFISIKVDREERPDLDLIYMQAVLSLAGNGGWPLSVFITPEGSPFYGGTYFPPNRRYGMPGFPELLDALSRLWVEDRDRLLNISSQVAEGIAGELHWAFSPSAEISPDIAGQAVQQLVKTYDWSHGGWGKAPRFPAPMSIDFLLTQAARGRKDALEPAVHALHAMNRGGMYDLVGGGFHRYSTDDEWLVPHFEKMLYDNAQLAPAYLHAYLLTGEPSFRRTCEETLQFIQAELTGPEGGFFSSLDADSEGVEGKFYSWNIEELQQLLSPVEFETLARECEISRQGNFEGKVILRQARLAGGENSAAPGEPTQLGPILDKLKQARSLRVRPAADDKVLVAWNSLAIQAFAEAGRYLNHPGFLASAQKNADFLLNNLVREGRLLRSWCKGEAHQDAFLEDYASLVIALFSLYQADFDLKWYQAACRLAAEMVSGFQDPEGGFFVTHQDAADLLIRPKDLQDNATPSGNALAAAALFILSAYADNPAWLSHAQQMIAGVQSLMVQYPTGFSAWLKAQNFAPDEISQAAITFPAGQAAPADLLNQYNAVYRPFAFLACSTFPLPPGSPELLHSRPPLDQKPTVYICKNFVCRRPITAAADIASEFSTLR